MVQYDFSGRCVLVTGGTSGIGLATAKAFARAGANVVVASRDAEAGAAAIASIEQTGAKGSFVRLDVRDEKSVAAAIEAAVVRHERLDVAFNCAGIGGDMAPLDRLDQGVWDDVMAVNARGAWLSMRAELRAMFATSDARAAIVNMSSIYGMAGKAAHHAYVASKHAVVGMTRSVAIEVAPRGVRVNALCAGVTATAGMKQAAAVVPALVNDLVSQHPIGRMATEEEIANVVLWLCSPGANYVTGTALAVDGGFLAA